MLTVKKDLSWVGVFDPNLRVFDIIMESKFGTTYNAYLLKTEKGYVLFETVKNKFFDDFLAKIIEVCDPKEIKYIVVAHTEPDHSGSISKILKYSPDAVVYASKIAINFLGAISNHSFSSVAVSNNETLNLGNYTLRFLAAPFLHWPDTIYTYIEENKTLVTCDSFGCHYSSEKVFNDQIEGDFFEAYKYYFDMIMGPFKKYVQAALKKIEKYEIETICPGHGPVLRKDVDYYIDLYDKWSSLSPKDERINPKITCAYVSAYGYTKILAEEIVRGIHDTIEADVLLCDMEKKDHAQVLDELIDSDGILLGTPTINGDALPPIMNLLMDMNRINHGGKVAGVFGSFGWSGEGVDMLKSRLDILKMKVVEPILKINLKPSSSDLAHAYAYGIKFAGKVYKGWVNIGKLKSGNILWKCIVCGEIFEGTLPPSTCIACGAGEEAFIEYVKKDIKITSTKKTRVLIIGGGVGAVSAAEAVRSRNEHAEIHLFSKEKSLPYYRPVLTSMISEKVGDETFYIKPPYYYDDYIINMHLGVEVTKVLKDEKRIETSSGTFFEYDKLVIATGSKAFMPPINGISLPEVVSLRDEEDFKKLDSLLKGGPKNISIIGGGLLGLETAHFLSKLKHNLTVIEAMPRILPRQLDESASCLLRKVIEDANINLMIKTYVEKIEGFKHVSCIMTDKNEHIPTDIVVISAGVRSNSQLAVSAGLNADIAINVNSKMQTSDPDIYAVGDCVAMNGRCDAIWETALMQGEVAGANIAEDITEYTPKIFGYTLNAFYLNLLSIGNIGLKYEEKSRNIEAKNEVEKKYKKFYFKNNILSGGILIGDMMHTTSLIHGVNNSLTIQGARNNKLF
ncbi:MAG: FAD-dependent oxidoreductase [bacterium]|nr:FAD-dependent oxidoreductase [bacterium]